MIRDTIVEGMDQIRVLEGKGFVLRIAHDTKYNFYSLGVQTKDNSHFKVISRELHDLIKKELT